MGDDFSASWAGIAAPMLNVVQLGRAAVVATSTGYTDAVLAETGQRAAAYGSLNQAAFVSHAPNGQTMDEVLRGSVVQAKVAVKAGASPSAALSQAESWLTGVLLTNLADTGRSVVGADIAQRPTLTGYTRMLNAPSCSRCVILAGKWFKWNDGFLRHPRCDCRHIPASEDVAGDIATDPYAYFNSLSPEAQVKAFGKPEARAINDGGDIYRVVNIKQNGLGTAKSAKRYGTPTRMTVDDIYRTAGHRTNALRMLEEQGYVTGPQVRGGNILGNGPAVQGFGQFGKGGKAKAATDAVLKANADGVRDPLNRYTMTAGERRLFDAKTRLDVGRTGIYPQSIGLNTADKYVKPRAISADELAILQGAYDNEVERLRGNVLRGIKPAPPSVQRLAALLGI